MSKKTIYVGCSLTHATEEFRLAIEELKIKLRKEYIVTDFLGLVKGSAKDAFEHDIDCVRRCDLFVAECSYPSTGLGIELGAAIHLDNQILAVAHKDAKVTRLVQGITHQKFTFKRYDDMREVVEMVKEKLKSL